MKPRAWIIATLLGSALLCAQDDLPKRAPGEPLDFEPKLMLDGPRALPAGPSPADSRRGGVEQMEAALRLAEQRAADSEQLFKEGILARMEVEGRMLRVVQARKELAGARLAAAAARADTVKKSFDARQAPQADLDAPNADLKTAQQTAETTAAEWNKAQIDAATRDLQRKRKLYAEGAGSRREVEMAEDRLALLSGTAAK